MAAFFTAAADLRLTSGDRLALFRVSLPGECASIRWTPHRPGDQAPGGG